MCCSLGLMPVDGEDSWKVVIWQFGLAFQVCCIYFDALPATLFNGALAKLKAAQDNNLINQLVS